MTSTYEDSVLDFDLTFLRQTSNNTGHQSKLERQKRSVALVKRKIIATNSLIGKYYDKRHELEESEKSLLDSKEECKQICIDYRNALETCAKLESDVLLIQNANKQLEEKCFHSETQYEAMKSHANQLQGLISEQKTSIETLQIENRLEKAASKENERKVLSLQKQNEILRDNILIFRDIILNKKKLNPKYKELLRKYDKPCNINESDEDPLDGGGNTDFEDDMFEEVMSPGSAPQSPQLNVSEVQKSHVATKHVLSTEFDNTEVVSVDTGRGSSLAFSDNDKCFHSPDYFADNSPQNREFIEHKIKPELTTAPSSQSHIVTTIEVATSPINVQDDSLLCQIRFEEDSNDICSSNDIQDDIEILQKPLIISNEVVNYINPLGLNSSIREGLTSPVKICGTAHDIKLRNKTQEKWCENLDMNSNSNICGDNSNDCEIATILNRMRLRHKLITPIPTSPAISWSTEPIQPPPNKCKQIEQGGNYVCHDALIAREENRKLQNNIADLAKEIINIKSLLKNHIFSNETFSSNNDGVALNQVLFDNNDEQDVNMTEKEDPPIAHAHDEDTSSPILEHIPTTVGPELESESLSTQHIESSLNEPNLSLSPNVITPAADTPENYETSIGTRIKSSLKYNICSNETFSSNDGVTLNQVLLNNNDDQDVNMTVKEDLPIAPAHDEDTIISIPILEHLPTSVGPESESESLSTQHIESSLNEPTLSLSPNVITPAADTPENDKTSIETFPKVLLHRLQFEDTMPLPDASLVNDKSTDDSNAMSDSDSDIIHNRIKDVDSDRKFEENHEKLAKHRKLTSLQKLKKKLGPKYKIKSDKPTPTPRKLRTSPKNILPPKKKVTPADTSASLNDKNVYEKAVKVMAELKSQQLNLQHSEVSKAKSDSTLSESLTANNLDSNQCIPRSNIKTRSRRKCVELFEDSPITATGDIEPNNNTEITSSQKKNEEIMPIITPRITRKRCSQSSLEKTEVQPKRLLRSSTSQQANNHEITNRKNESNDVDPIKPRKYANPTITLPISDIPKQPSAPLATESRAGVAISYDDMDMFSPENNCPEPSDYSSVKDNRKTKITPKESLLCKMVDKHGVQKIKNTAKKASEKTITSIYEKINSEMAKIIELPCGETKKEMNNLVAYIKTLNYRNFMTALMQYLTHSERKAELFGKVNLTPAPPMTKSEQVLLYVIIQLRNFWPSIDFADAVLCNIEYILFKLNRTPEFDVIESISHFYAVLCRYFKAKSRLRLFILDAMYCIQFKSVPLIKQCLDVWMHTIPLAHMGIAKSPLVTCLVYLLHFYKCEDRFNRVQELRNILNRKYFYQITEWNETKMLDMIRQAIMDVKDVPIEKKMLRLALIIVAKRQGTRWCQNQAIKNVIMPFIEKDDVPENVKVFCISMIGALMKPYPIDMKVHTEIAMNQLINMLNGNPSKQIEEAIITSLVYMSKHNQNRVTKVLLTRKNSAISTELEDILRDFVREKPLKIWKTIVKKMRFL